MVTARQQDAYAAWQAAIGQEFVVFDSALVAAAATATFATSHRVPAILRPANREQVQQCVRIANEFGVPLYPVSSGKNWGYGSRVPTADGCVLLDLGRLTRILDFSEELAYVTVEPGVTQGQLQEFLRSRGSNLWMDATGASPECSLIGNTVERGFGHTPYGDHFAHSCGLEVILPTGELVETGFCRYPGAQAGPLYRWGHGPVLDGLFSQSNLGIVTRLSIWLMPAPEYFQAYFFRCDHPEDLSGLIDALRPLRLNGTIRSTVHIGNDYKVLSGLQQYPWNLTGGRTPLPADILAQLRNQLKFGVWNGSGGLYGTRVQVAEARRLIRQALRGKVSKLEFLDDRKLALASRFARIYQLFTGWDITRALELLRPVYGLMKGIPTEQPLASAYWRKRTPPPARMNPDLDGCGLLWCSPVAPCTGEHAIRLSQITQEILPHYGFEPAISISLLTERAICSVISISYDRAVPGEDERALTCHRKLIESLNEHGYYPYRLGVQSMAHMDQTSSQSRLLLELKTLLDPAGILAPGRYQPAPGRAVQGSANG